MARTPRRPQLPRVRLAVLSDIHGNLVALEAVLADLRGRAPDLTVNLGDCATGPLWPLETMELLDGLALPTVRGNHDRWLAVAADDDPSASVRFTREVLGDARRHELAALPPTIAPCDGVLAVHGTPASDTDYLLEELVDGRLALARPATIEARLGDARASLVLCGHSHLAGIAGLPDGTVVLNPGSVGAPRYADNADPTVAEAGSTHARYAIATRRGGRWSVELHAVAYDRDRAVAQARRNGRPDWVRGFLREGAAGA